MKKGKFVKRTFTATPVAWSALEHPKITRCQASRGDGECYWKDCPQIRDGEPQKSGRVCPLWKGEYE